MGRGGNEQRRHLVATKGSFHSWREEGKGRGNKGEKSRREANVHENRRLEDWALEGLLQGRLGGGGGTRH